MISDATKRVSVRHYERGKQVSGYEKAKERNGKYVSVKAVK